MKNELYFPHPDEINDPFDCKIPPCLEGLTKEKLLEHLENIDPKRVKDKGFDLEKSKKGVINTPLLVLQECLRRDLKSHIEVGVLSFSEKYSDILMWGHYADSHKGICIGFDYYKLSFTFKGPVPPEQVKYPDDNEYPKWNPFDGTVMTRDKAESICEKIYFTKAINWKYEKEWRVVLPEHGRSLQKISPSALVSVHLGCQIAKSDKDDVINWCLQREQKPKIYQMIKDDTSYSLKENEISY